MYRFFRNSSEIILMFLVLSYRCTLIMLSLADAAALLNTSNSFSVVSVYSRLWLINKDNNVKQNLCFLASVPSTLVSLDSGIEAGVCHS